MEVPAGSVDVVLESEVHQALSLVEHVEPGEILEVTYRLDRHSWDDEVVVYGEAIREEVDRILQLTAGRDNVCLGTGALPYETPPENVLFVKEYCKRLAEFG